MRYLVTPAYRSGLDSVSTETLEAAAKAVMAFSRQGYRAITERIVPGTGVWAGCLVPVEMSSTESETLDRLISAAHDHDDEARSYGLATGGE